MEAVAKLIKELIATGFAEVAAKIMPEVYLHVHQVIGDITKYQRILEDFAANPTAQLGKKSDPIRSPSGADGGILGNSPDQATSDDHKADRPKKNQKSRRIRQMTAAAARCASLYRSAKRRDPGVRMRHIVNEYADRHDVSAETIMRVLNDHPDQWKDDQITTKTRPPDDTGRT